MATAPRALPSSSALNDEVTHDNRESQLQPREAQDARRSLMGRRSADQESAGLLDIEEQAYGLGLIPATG